MELAKFYESRFLFYKACIKAHICGTGLLAMNRFVVQENGNVISTGD